MAPRIHLKLALVLTIGVLASVAAAPQPKPQSKTETTYSSSSSSSSSSLTAPAILTPTSSENVRFSRLLRDNSEGLRFTSLSNVAPELARAISKESKEKLSNAIPGNSVKFGRRVLDYNDDSEVDESALKIITRPEPGNEYVYIQPPGIATAQERSIEDASGGATLTAINKKAINHRIPVALLRQTMGNRVNINPVFPNLNFDEEPITGERQNSFNQIPNDPQEVNFEATTVAPHFYNEEYEATTIPAISVPEVEEVVAPVVTTTERVHKRKKMVVNVITSGPRVVFDNTTSVAASTTTTEPPKSSTATSASKAEDEKENLLVQASSNRVKTFPDFEDSPTRLQTAESSSQPARVNVRPASSGKDYEYEYIYYYYDDDDDSENGTKRATTAATVPDDIVTKIPATTTTTYATTTSTTTTTTTPAPVFESYEEEDEEEIEEKPVSPKSAAPLKNSFASSPPASTGHKQYITEKVTASNPSNLLEKSRGQKTFPSSVAEAPEAAATRQVEQDISNEQDDEDYEDAHDEPKREILSSSLRGQNQGREPTSESPSTDRDSTTVNARQATSGLYDNMQKLPKPHPTSVNTPIVLKQSSLIRVPAKQLPGAIEDDEDDAPPATPATTTTTTTTAEPEVTSRAPHKFRAQTIRLRGNSAGSGGNTISRAIPTAPAENAVEKQEAPVRSRAPSATYKEATRIVSRRPHVGKPAQEAPQASPSIAVQSEDQSAPAPRPIVSRTRFPLRTTAASPVVETAAPVTTPEVSYQPISSEVSSAAPVDANSVNDRKAKENFVKNKSANDLFAFTRLQQAIHSRQPSRNKELANYNKATAPKVGGFLSSQEQTTDTPDSSASNEYTTAAPYVSGSSAESSQVVTELPAAPTTTATTTTTEAVQLDRFGKPKRFPGRTRRPPSAVGGVATTTTTEAPKPSGAQIAGGNRAGGFNGRRRKFGTTPAPSADVHENVVSSSASSPSSESAPAPVSRVTPSRSRFASRNRGAATTETSPDTQNKEEATGEQSTTAPVTPRRRQQSHFAGRKRLNKATQATNEESESSPATSPAPTTVPAAAAAPAAPKAEGEHQRNRFNYGSNNGRAARPAGPGPRIRSQRLGGSTTTTTEAPAEQVAEVAAENHETAEQVSAGEQTDAAPSTTAAPEPPKRGSAGVLGRLRNRSKPATTTTAAPEPVQERKPQRGGGLLNRRKQATAPTTTTAAPAVNEEEESSNNAQEQLESQHKGVVVQISSSVSEGEEVQEQAEESEPSSTTAASILNRLKIQRKPGSIYRKRPEPQGE